MDTERDQSLGCVFREDAECPVPPRCSQSALVILVLLLQMLLPACSLWSVPRPGQPPFFFWA